jgi:hypothetical protein
MADDAHARVREKGEKIMTREELFWSHVDIKGAGDCWNWTACVDHSGYGKTRYMGVMSIAHRVAYRLAKTDPGKLHVLHVCDNPLCCNPSHLWLGTHQDNMDDREKKGRNRGSSNLFWWNGRHTKLKKEIVDQIRQKRADGYSFCELGKLFSIHASTARAITAYAVWKDAPLPYCEVESLGGQNPAGWNRNGDNNADTTRRIHQIQLPKL